MKGLIKQIYSDRNDENSSVYNYIAYFPPGYNGVMPFPLIYFIHGALERGHDLSKIEKHPIFTKMKNAHLSALVLAPQCNSGERWETSKLFSFYGDMMRFYAIDAKRVYLTGLSMGGFATWNFAGEHPGLFAAIAPICGGGLTHLAHQLKKMPVRTYHGTNDEIIPIAKSYEMNEAVKAAGGNPEFIEMKGYGHDCWTDVYLSDEFYQWLFSHRKP